MKRIVFLLKTTEQKKKRMGFSLRMLLHGVKVSYLTEIEPSVVSEGTLCVVTDASFYSKIRELDTDALVCIEEPGQMDDFEGAKYFIMDPFMAEYSYYEKVYKRIRDIPWNVLSTKRLLIRETTEDDVDEFAKMYKNPEMTRYMEDLYSDIEEEKKYAREYRDRVYATQGFGIWTVVRKSDGKVIGRAGLTAREGFDELEIGFAIGCDYQRNGYATEAIRAILKYAAKNEMGLINALVMPGNEASICLLKKEGFVKVTDTKLNGTDYQVWRTQG